MISMNDYINSLGNANNLAKSNLSNQQIMQKTDVSKLEIKSDTFKSGKINNRKRNIIIASAIGVAALITAFIKRKDIENFFSNLFKKKSSEINLKMPTETPSTTEPINIIEKIQQAQQNRIQYAIDDLTIRADNKALNCGVGFYGPKSIAREEAFENFIQAMSDNGYKIKRIPTLDEATPDEIADSIYNTQKLVQQEFERTGKRTLIAIRDLDIIGIRDPQEGDLIKLQRQLLNMEHGKERGFAWVWDAEDKNDIDKSLLRRTTDFVLIRPSIEDSKKTWDSYIALISNMPQGERRESLLSDANSSKPSIFPIKIQPAYENRIEYLTLLSKNSTMSDGDSLDTLHSYQEKTLSSIEDLSNIQNVKNVILSQKIKDEPLIDFWLKSSGKNPCDFTQRLKNMWLNEILNNEDQTNKLISLTLDELQKENALIKMARNGYKDILDNEDELNQAQKEILAKQQDSKLFFMVISNGLSPEDNVGLQINTIKVVKTLTYEKETVKQNAINNIFNQARNVSLYDENSSDILDFIFDLLAQKSLSANPDEKEILDKAIQDFCESKDSGNENKFNFAWQKLIDLAQNYFETQKLDELTNRNIYLLDSINKK